MQTSPSTCRLSDVVVTRTAGLPVSSLLLLRCEDFAARAEEVLAERTELGQEGAALADRLHAIIGHVAHDATAGTGLPGPRRELLELRRRLHQGRLPGERLLRRSVLDVLGSVAPDVLQWCERARRADEEGAALELVLAKDQQRCIQDLRQALRAPAFRRALALAGPSLLDELDKWHGDPDRAPKTAKVLRLARYAARSSAKTSPYSTFLHSAPHRCDAAHAAAVGAGAGWLAESRAEGAAGPVRTVLELDGAVLDSLHRLLRRRPAWSRAALVRVTPAAVGIDDDVAFISAGQGQPVARLPLTPAVRLCLELAGDADVRTVGDLVGRLRRQVDDEPAAAEAYVRHLLSLGLLESWIPVPDAALDPFGELARWLGAAPDLDPHDKLVVAAVDALGQTCRRDVPVADVAAHRMRLREIECLVHELESLLGAALRPADDELVHETALARTTSGGSLPAALSAVAADLDVTRRFLAVFDAKLPIRLALSVWFTARWGPEAQVPLVVLLGAVQALRAGRPAAPSAPASAVADAEHDLRLLLGPTAPSWQSDLSATRSARLRAVDALRRTARSRVWQTPVHDGAVRLDAATLSAVVDGWPDWVTGPTSVACYLQILPEQVGVPERVVVNVIHAGHGRGMSRLSHQLRQLGQPGVPLAAPQPTGEGAALAELSGLLGSTLNVRDAVAPYEIDLPGSRSDRPADQRIALSDLVCRQDPGTEQLVLCSVATGAPVAPLHLGMAADVRLPAAASFIERAFGSGVLVHPSAPALVSGVGPGTGARGDDGMVGFPRVVVGRVVVQRARWFIRAEQVPRRPGAAGDAAYLLALAAWRRCVGLPERVFFRAWTTAAGTAQTKARKPLYLDFASALLVLDFERLVTGSEFVLFDEALPDPVGDGADRVQELLVELTAVTP